MCLRRRPSFQAKAASVLPQAGIIIVSGPLPQKQATRKGAEKKKKGPRVTSSEALKAETTKGGNRVAIPKFGNKSKFKIRQKSQFLYQKFAHIRRNIDRMLSLRSSL